ncbi:hypothetical protein AAFF_G00080640 [Aldrovandia affinis]|uniref:Uncharacterized protein n=1 Tax=Aldrovandia affinis TaxID=143900 RepID=A0AAD7T4G3_9TELE|nr:hypothetical protein AAFF_G00080640 [Aldrovandia affinis]
MCTPVLDQSTIPTMKSSSATILSLRMVGRTRVTGWDPLLPGNGDIGRGELLHWAREASVAKTGHRWTRRPPRELR